MTSKLGIEVTVHIHHHHYNSCPSPQKSVPVAANKSVTAAVLQTIGEMGATAGSCRTWAREHFKKAGLSVTSGSGNITAPYVVVHPQTGLEYRIPVYATVTLKQSTGQVGFTVGGLDCSDFDWYAFVAQPFGRMYLRRRTEIVKGIRRRKAVRSRAYVSFSPGPEENLFENRITELLNGLEEEKNEINRTLDT